MPVPAKLLIKFLESNGLWRQAFRMSVYVRAVFECFHLLNSRLDMSSPNLSGQTSKLLEDDSNDELCISDIGSVMVLHTRLDLTN